MDEKCSISNGKYWSIILIFIIFCVLVKLPMIRFQHPESDEMVYWTLATKIVHAGEYNILNTDILNTLSPNIYNKTLFHHPPLYPFLLTPFVLLEKQNLAIIISWIGHILAIIAVAQILLRISQQEKFKLSPSSVIFWIPIIAITFDPFMTFLSRKLWIENILIGLCSLSVSMFYEAMYNNNRKLYMFLSGILLGLACLSKLPAVIISPIIIIISCIHIDSNKERFKSLLFVFIPAFIIMIPWIYVFYSEYGVITPSWIKPDSWLLENDPFIRQTVFRNPFYYIKQLFFLNPVLFVLFIIYIKHFKKINKTESIIPITWILIFLGFFSYLGYKGYGYQTRYIMIVSPAIYILMYPIIDYLFLNKFLVWNLFILLLIIYAGISGSLYIFWPRFDEIFALLELAKNI